MNRNLSYLIITVLMVLLSSACSMKQMAVNTVGDVLGSGGSVYESDNDIELVGEALPFGLKLTESLLAESPNHPGLLMSASRGFMLYAYGYVHFDAEVAASEDIDRARTYRKRAQNLYLRAHAYALRALDLAYPGISSLLPQDPVTAMAMISTDQKERDLPLLYWSAASLGMAISVSKQDMSMLARLPEVDALIDQAMALDPEWNAGSLYEFEISWAAGRPGAMDYEIVRGYFERAEQLAQGRRASLYLAYAEAVTIPKQQRERFKSLMAQALAVDPDADPDNRLLNLIAQRRAQWLLERIDELFL
jgi:predicted anti-sigma-YlaC factor YlaD